VQLSASATNASSNGNGPSESADDDLPSVMTCANYLKLPPYSSKVEHCKALLILWSCMSKHLSILIFDFHFKTGNYVQEATLCNQWRPGILWFIMTFRN